MHLCCLNADEISIIVCFYLNIPEIVFTSYFSKIPSRFLSTYLDISKNSPN